MWHVLSCLTNPALHVQFAMLVLRTLDVALCGHVVQVVDAGEEEKVPAGHTAQPEAVPRIPGGHEAHDDASCEKYPKLHVHDVEI